MLNDTGIGRLPVGVVHHRIPLEIGTIQNLRLKTQTSVGQRTVAKTVKGIQCPREKDPLRLSIPIIPVFQVVHPCTDFSTGQHFLHHSGVSTSGNSLKACSKIVIVIGKADRETANNKRRKLPAASPPLLFRVALHQHLIQLPANKGNRLLL